MEITDDFSNKKVFLFVLFVIDAILKHRIENFFVKNSLISKTNIHKMCLIPLVITK